MEYVKSRLDPRCGRIEVLNKFTKDRQTWANSDDENKFGILWSEGRMQKRRANMMKRSYELIGDTDPIGILFNTFARQVLSHTRDLEKTGLSAFLRRQEGGQKITGAKCKTRKKRTSTKPGQSKGAKKQKQHADGTEQEDATDDKNEDDGSNASTNGMGSADDDDPNADLNVPGFTSFKRDLASLLTQPDDPEKTSAEKTADIAALFTELRNDGYIAKIQFANGQGGSPDLNEHLYQTQQFAHGSTLDKMVLKAATSGTTSGGKMILRAKMERRANQALDNKIANLKECNIGLESITEKSVIQLHPGGVSSPLVPPPTIATSNICTTSIHYTE